MKNSLAESTKIKTNENKRIGINYYSKFNNNAKIKEIKPISVINFKPNNTTYIINTPNKKDIKFEFLKRNNKFNKNRYQKLKGLENYSFNSDFKRSEKNYSFLNDNQIKEMKLAEKNNSLDVKNNKNIHKKSKPHNYKNDYITTDTKVEVTNNNILYSINYRNKHNKTNNNSSLENSIKKKNEYRNKSNNKDIIENYMEYNDNNKEIENKRNRNSNYNFKNNCIKIISNNRKYKDLQNKISSKAYNADNGYNTINENNENENSDLYKYVPPKSNNDMIINVNSRRTNYLKKIEQKEQENQEEENKYFKDKNDNLKLRMNIISNRVFKRSIKQFNNTDKSINSENYNKNNHSRCDINGKGDKTERNDNSTNHQTYTYIRRNMNDDISNKYSNDDKNSKYYKTKILNKENKKNERDENKNTNSCDKKNDYGKNKNKWTINIMNKMNISNFPSITIDMNILNKNNKKYLELYDAIKNKL